MLDHIQWCLVQTSFLQSPCPRPPTQPSLTHPGPPHHKSRSCFQGYLGINDPLRHSTAKFYHVFLDLCAFIASPCVPGEIATISEKGIFVLYTTDSRMYCMFTSVFPLLQTNLISSHSPEWRISELVPVESTTQPAFKIMRHSDREGRCISFKTWTRIQQCWLSVDIRGQILAGESG